VLVLSFLADPIAPIQVKAMEGAAPSLGVTLQVQDIRTADDIPAAFEAASRARAEGALTTEESMFIGAPGLDVAPTLLARADEVIE
jgi:putative tryptophan/tyrosine transport system substrate-binding protein